jgi:mycothiol system anti-sigma-R factor
MNCNQAISDLYTFLDNEVASLRRNRIEWHLRRCPPCASAFHFEESLQVKVRIACSGEEIPVELIERLRAFINQTDIGGDEPTV